VSECLATGQWFWVRKSFAEFCAVILQVLFHSDCCEAYVMLLYCMWVLYSVVERSSWESTSNQWWACFWWTCW